MEELLDLILTPLEVGLSGQVRQRLAHSRNDPDAEEDGLYLFREALQDAPAEGLPEGWLGPARCRWWLCLHVDWKAFTEVAWQVQAICRTLGLEPGFVSQAEAQWDSFFTETDRLRSRHPESSSLSQTSQPDGLEVAPDKTGETVRRAPPVTPPTPSPPSDTPTLDVLEDASGWLGRQGYELLYLETGGDDYLAVPVRLGLLSHARTLAERLGIPTFLV